MIYEEEKSNQTIQSAREEGRKEGLKKGLEKGLKKGLEKGREKGLEEGIALSAGIIRALKEKVSVDEIAAQYRIPVDKIEPLLSAFDEKKIPALR